ncbi:MAG: histidine phosphatase family protein [Anaerolineales bacterium]
MELYFIRHGQSQNNAHWSEPGYIESPDPALTDLGREQAQWLAEFLSARHDIRPHASWNVHNRHGFGFTHLYTSLMERAVHTAAPTARALGLPFIAWPEIHEGGGIFSREDKANPVGLPGKPRSYFERHFPELQLPPNLDESGWWQCRPFEEEEAREARARKFLADLLERHGDREGQPEQRVAIVSHGGFFMHLMCAMLKLPWRQAAHNLTSWFLLSNASISRFDINHDGLTICYLNRVDYLPDHLITG